MAVNNINDKKGVAVIKDSNIKLTAGIEKKVTIKDIARETELSVATVSRVINKVNRHYSEATEKRVSDAVKRLNYTPNIIAWGLKKQKTNTIGFIVPELDSYYSEIFLGAQDVAMKHGYTNFLCNTNYNVEFEKLYFDNLLARRVDGVVIATGLIDSSHVYRLLREGIKIALIECDLEIPDVVSVVIDNYKYSRLAVQHLIDNGYKRIGFVSAPLEEMKNLKERFGGYVDALKCNNMDIDDSVIYFNRAIRGEWDLTSSSELIRAIMSDNKNRPDALYIISDSVAMAAIQVIKKLGLRIPADIGIVGFDDRRFCKYLEPPLTSIHQPKYEMGAKSTELLIKTIENKEVLNKKIYLEMQLSIRESSSRITIKNT